jgi:hypothetical protein
VRTHGQVVLRGHVGRRPRSPAWRSPRSAHGQVAIDVVLAARAGVAGDEHPAMQAPGLGEAVEERAEPGHDLAMLRDADAAGRRLVDEELARDLEDTGPSRRARRPSCRRTGRSSRA